MDVLTEHTVKDDQPKSTDWTSIGARILEAATLATAIHLDELARGGRWSPGAGEGRPGGLRGRERSNGIG